MEAVTLGSFSKAKTWPGTQKLTRSPSGTQGCATLASLCLYPLQPGWRVEQTHCSEGFLGAIKGGSKWSQLTACFFGEPAGGAKLKRSVSPA
jgi:hypothetical protein